MSSFINKTFKPINLAKIEANKPNYRSQIVPPKKGKKSKYKRKDRNNKMWSFFMFT